MPTAPSNAVSFDTTEGTFINVDVSPDGETLVLDLLGDIYWLPIQGGDVEPLTTGRAWDQSPRFSPDGRYVYFLSDREGHNNVWLLRLADRSLQQVTQSASDVLGGLNWSLDGDHLLAGLAWSETSRSEIILQAIDPVTGSMTPIDAPSGPWIDLDTFKPLRCSIKIFSAVESADGEVFFSQAQLDEEAGLFTVRMYRFDLHTQTRAAITSVDASYSEYKPQLSHNGHLLAYFRQYNDRRTEIRILNRRTGQDDALIELADADDAHYRGMEDTTPNYAFTPDDRQLIFWHGGKIHRVGLDEGLSTIIPFRAKVEREVSVRVQPSIQQFRENGEATAIRWPSVSRDAKTIVFEAVGYVWVMDMQMRVARRLRSSTDFEYMPTLSPNGMLVAFISFARTKNGYGSGRLVVVDLDSGTSRELLAASGETYLLPRWSHDGQKIAVIREIEDPDGIEFVKAAFGWTPVADGQFHEVTSAPTSSERLGAFIYSRFVGFDTTGRHLLFSLARSRTKTVLAAADLDGGDQRVLAIGTSEVGGITPAPDLNNLALTRHDGTVWIVPFDSGIEQSLVSTSSADAHRVSDGGGYYVDWIGSQQVTYGFGQNVYRHQLGCSESESFHVSLEFEKPKAAHSIAFTGARLITLSDNLSAGSVIESGTIVLDGQRIVSVGSADGVAIPSDAIVIDVAGKTIMPGLLDVHYHRIGGAKKSALAFPYEGFSDRTAITHGVTTAWEPGAAPNDGVAATADLQAAGRIAGPRWSHSAMGAVGYPWGQLTSYTAALAAVEQHYELGVDVLKEYNTPTRQQRQWLSAGAYQTGMGIVSHLDSFYGMMTRIVDGYTGGEHPRIPAPFFKDVHEMLRQTGYVWTPNILITSGTIGARQDKRNYFCHAVLEWRNRTRPEGSEAKSICPADRSSASVPYGIHRVSRVAKQAASAASDGVNIGVSAHNLPGILLHLEMWYLWKGGMPIDDVLRATTIGNAEKLGLQEEVGSLEVGKIADFLVLDANPLDDLLNTLSLKYTVQGGVVYDSTTGKKVDVLSLGQPSGRAPVRECSSYRRSPRLNGLLQHGQAPIGQSHPFSGT